MAKFIKVPLTARMENDYEECVEAMEHGRQKCCEECSLNGGSEFECMSEYQWCEED